MRPATTATQALRVAVSTIARSTTSAPAIAQMAGRCSERQVSMIAAGSRIAANCAPVWPMNASARPSFSAE